MSDFTTEGREPFPSIHQDNEQVHLFADWTTEALNERFGQYNRFLQTDPMPRAKEGTRRILAHLVFELSYREGIL